MKREGYLFDKMSEPSFIELAIRKASVGKRRRAVVARVLSSMPEHVEIIRQLIVTDSFNPAPYHVFERYDSRNKKNRKIQRPKFFPDQCIHWMIVLACKKIFMRGMYFWNSGSIPKRGIRHGMRCVNRWMHNDHKNTKYVLKLDIRKYYDSIPHDKLMLSFSKKIKDKRMLQMLSKIVKSTGGTVGIPIGNYTSQWFANFYLEGLDHFIKEQIGVEYYTRYIDDMVLFGRNKKRLHRARIAIHEYLSINLGLDLKHNYQVFPADSRGLDFLGFVQFHTHRKLRKRNGLALIRQSRRIRKKLSTNEQISYKDASGFISRIGSFSFFNSFHMQQKYGNIDIDMLKDTIRSYTKRFDNISKESHLT